MNAHLKQWEQAHPKSLQTPSIAWPTLGLCLAAIVFFFSSTILGFYGKIPLFAAILINATAQFMLFTVAHDAVHRSLSQYAKLNEVLGAISLFILSPLAGIKTFRFIHAQHHRFTNEDIDKDPDAWCGRGRRYTLPFRWMTLDMHYFFWYAKKWNTRPKKEKINLLTTLILSLAVFITLSYLGYGFWILCLWFIPSRLAIVWLALGFDYLPHYPHDTTGNEDPFLATNVRPQYSNIMTVLLLNQNYHLIHHLYPRQPFYRYRRLWQSLEPLLPIMVKTRRYDWRGRLLTAPTTKDIIQETPSAKF